jgi:hypothetical protein
MPPKNDPADATSFAPDLEIVGDQVRLQPTGFTGGPEGGITERKLVRDLGRFRENPLEFLRGLSLFISGSGWRAYDDYIGQPIFYSGFSEKMMSNIMNHPLLLAKVNELAETRTKVEEEQGLLNTPQGVDDLVRGRRKNEITSHLREVVEKVVDNMICKMESKMFIRGAYYFATQLLTRAYHQGRSFPSGRRLFWAPNG